MKIGPLGHRVLVRKANIDERDPVFRRARESGIVLAETDDHRRREAGVDRGWVVAIGDEAFKSFYRNSHGSLDGFKPWVKEGDYIAFAKYGGMPIANPDSEDIFIVMNDEDVVALLEE